MSFRRIGEGGVYTLSILLTGVVIGNAFHQKKQFYPSVVYLTKSNPSLAILAVQALVFVVLLGKLTRKIFFGSLRPAEVEHLIERSWYAVTETCLAFTVFREDFNSMFVAMFTMLLFFKCFHWLAEDRVDYMERSPQLGCLFHTRIIGLLTTLAVVDCYFMKRAYLTTVLKGASAQLVFGFEYAILLTIVFTVLVKYILHCIDLYDENPWENKAVYLLYLELITSGWKFLLYVVFVVIMSRVHTLPLFAVRPLYLTMRSFKKALTDVILSRRAIRNMNQLYPDATAEDLQSVDDCIICREPMQAQGGCKKLPCAHIFHASCLRSWFQRQQTCPTCRMEVLNTRPAVPTAPAAAAPAAPAQPAANPWPAFNPAAAQQRPPAAAGQAANQPAPPQFTPLIPNAQMPNVPNMAGAHGAEATPFPSQPGVTPVPPPPMPPPGMFPFMGMPMPPMAPPPMPQANLASLTEEQLKVVESDERAGLEARIQWLRDIQTLLDSAVEQMHQYTLVMSALNATRPPTMPTNQASASPRTADSTSTSTTNAAGPDFKPSQPTAEGSEPQSSSAIDNTSGARPKTTSPALSTIGAQSQPTSSGSPTTSDAEELRRRRLAKFEQQS